VAAARLIRERIRIETAKALTLAPYRQWPVENCVVFCADIYVAAGFQDPIIEYRGKYHTEAEAYELMGQFGMHGLHARCAKRMGWKRTDAHEDGDWGLVRTEAGPSSAIRYGGHWVNSRVGGFAVVEAKDLIAAWKVC
jgi:hypothetical protein